ncbi:MAG: hypothetical protein ACJ8EW_06390 [Rhizobium sp.]|uniref:hypothetical protein n=1 Tax=Rhizobium sp. TaxID=391 RepID=UPI0038999B53
MTVIFRRNLYLFLFLFLWQEFDRSITSHHTVLATKSTASQQLDDDASSSAKKLMSQLMAMAMNASPNRDHGQRARHEPGI